MTRPPDTAEAEVAALMTLAADCDAASNSLEIFGAVARAADVVLGFQLLTILTLDPATLEVQRYYTSNETAYPTGGKKPMRDTPWGRQVLQDGRPFVGTQAADIRAHFADHELIISLGLESIVNLPVRWQGQVLGTLNLLHGPGYYSDASVAVGRLLTPHLVAPLMTLKH